MIEWLESMTAAIDASDDVERIKEELRDLAEQVASSPAFHLLRGPFEIWVARQGWKTLLLPNPLPRSVALSNTEIAMQLKLAGKSYGNEAVRSEREARVSMAEARVKRAQQAIEAGWDEVDARIFVCSEEEYERARRQAYEHRPTRAIV